MRLAPQLRSIAFWVFLLGTSMGVTPRIRAEEGRPILRSFSARETGSEDSAYWSSAQDERGVMYFSSDKVTTYDGERWKQYQVPGTSVVRALSIGKSGRLWIAALNQIGYFDRLPTGELGAFQSLAAHVPAEHRELGDVWHVFATSQVTIFVTSTAVLVWDGSVFHIHVLPGERRLPAFQTGERVFVYQRSTGIWEIEQQRLRLEVSTAELGGAGALWMEPREDGWRIVTTDGLVDIRKGRRTLLAGPFSSFLKQNVITSACKLPDGRICAGSLAGAAVSSADNRDAILLREEDGLPSPNAISVLSAADGTLWLTSTSGVTRALLDGVSVFDSATGLAGRPCNGIAEHGSGLFVSTDHGVFRLSLDGSSPSATFQPVAEMSERYLDLAAGSDGVIAAGFLGVYRHDGRLTQLFRTRVEPILLTSSLQSGSYLVADNLELLRLSRAADGTLHSTHIAQLPDLPVAAADTGGQHVWVGTSSRGAFRFDERDGQSVPVLFRDQPYLGRALVGRLGPSIAVCTNGGIELHAAGQPTAVLVSNVPASNPLAISEENATRSIWVAFASPFADGTRVPILGQLTATATSAQWQPFAVPGLELVGNINRLYVDSRGILWIGGTEALLRVDPAQLKPVVPPRAPLLSGSIALGAEIPLHANTLTFQFSALEYGRRETLRFQTRLSGAADWSAPTDASHLTLAGFRDGEHEFSVRVINDAGMTSPVASWQFTVLPPWYRTKPALAAWVLLAAAGFIGGIHWRSAYLRAQNLRLEALVRKKTEQLEQANAAKSEFLANMSHEIRNPISGIVGLSLAIEETTLNERQQQLTNSIRSCAALLATLVDDVLDFSKIEAGKIELRLAPFDLRASLEQCAAMVAEELRASGGAVEFVVPDDVPDRVVGDSARVQQIVLNYLTNAVKFGAGKPVLIGATKLANGRIRLWVRDHGPGMSAAEASTLFTKFTRLDRARTQNIRGTGLGLAVCRLLATKMGGSVGVESQLGEGSCFWTELPLAAAEPAGASGAIVAPASTPLHALIVEDIEYNAIAMQAVLRKLGITSDVAADGPTALRKLQSDRYDMAFMDWNLPGMIGTEVVSRYRAVEAPDRRTIIIATTAYSGAFNQEACLRAGMDAFVSKPFTPEKIAAALRDLRGPLRAAASVEVSRRSEEPVTPVPELDLQLLQILGDESEGGLAAQIDRYLEAFSAERNAAAAAIQCGDGKEIHRAAHRMISHATMVKYEPLAQLASQLQAHAASNEPERLARLLAEFDTEFGRFRSKLDSIRASQAPA